MAKPLSRGFDRYRRRVKRVKVENVSDDNLRERKLEGPAAVPEFSEKMTATAGNVLGVSQGGKIATGTNPKGVNESASNEIGLLPIG